MTNSTLQKNLIQAGAAFAAIGVILGAFTAHQLRPLLHETDRLTFETGVRYLFYHAFGLLMMGFGMRRLKENVARAAFYLFVIGIFLFTGSLCLYSTSPLWAGGEHVDWMGPITPVGGVAFIAGWLYLALKGFKPTSADESNSGRKIMKMQRRSARPSDAPAE